MNKPQDNLFSNSSTLSNNKGVNHLQKDPKRILLTAKVLPKTKKCIDEMRGEISIGKLLDDNLGSSVPQPPGWAEDELTKFLKIAHENGYATFVKEKQYWPRMKQIDTLYHRILQNMDHSREWFLSLFFYRAHSIWRAAIRLATSGQNPEAHILLRSCLENALYAFFINNDQKAWQNAKSHFMTWINREQSEATENKCRSTFQTGKIISELKTKDRQLGSIAEMIYDQSISHGSHPNVHGTLANISMWSDKKEGRVETQYLNCGNEAFRYTLKRACQCGLCALLIFKIIFKERFDILGLSDDIERLKKGL